MAPVKKAAAKGVSKKAASKRQRPAKKGSTPPRTLFASVELKPKSLRDDIAAAARVVLAGNHVLDPGLPSSFYRPDPGDWLQAASEIVKLVKQRYRVKPISSSEALATHTKPVSTFITLIYGRIVS